jgi:hypothetical protein
VCAKTKTKKDWCTPIKKYWKKKKKKKKKIEQHAAPADPGFAKTRNYALDATEKIMAMVITHEIDRCDSPDGGRGEAGLSRFLGASTTVMGES